MTRASDPDELRRRYRYRDLILRGKIRLSVRTARRLVGPDCAYHLYRHVCRDGEPPEAEEGSDKS